MYTLRLFPPLESVYLLLHNAAVHLYSLEVVRSCTKLYETVSIRRPRRTFERSLIMRWRGSREGLRFFEPDTAVRSSQSGTGRVAEDRGECCVVQE
jgi:hypothetical protein